MDVLMILLAYFGGCVLAGAAVFILLGCMSGVKRKMWTAWRRGRDEDGD